MALTEITNNLKNGKMAMNILERLNIIRHKDSGIRDFCIQTIRFKTLLENATALLDLFEDGNEKLSGEYILDRHYVTSLIDNVIEKLGMTVHDACMLAPEKGKTIYEQYDQHKLKAEKLIKQKIAVKKKDNYDDGILESTPLIYPEYQLLSDALEWFYGKESDSAVMDLIKQTLLNGIGGIESMDGLKNEINFKLNGLKNQGSDVYLFDVWKDPVNPPKNHRSLDDIDSVSFKRLLSDIADYGSSTASTSNAKPVTWIAATSDHEISLNTLNSVFSFRLDAVMTGHEDSDYIFVFTDNSFDTDQIIPQGFHTEKTSYGRFSWKRYVSMEIIENSLTAIGKNLLNSTA
jgi:hypothetical protein